MSLLLWVLQVSLTVHSAAAAVWKLSNIPYLVSLFPTFPSEIWPFVSVGELFMALMFVIAIYYPKWRRLSSLSAGIIVVQMVAYVGIYLSSGAANYGPVYYWSLVAIVSAFVAYLPYGAKIKKALRRPKVSEEKSDMG